MTQDSSQFLTYVVTTGSLGEKESYFYCPRDRKYKNSARPNRITRSGFWKATGTDRPIYSSSCTIKSCVGFKKSLVFYTGRAAKCTKTDWMMHEFRLVSASDVAKRVITNNIPASVKSTPIIPTLIAHLFLFFFFHLKPS